MHLINDWLFAVSFIIKGCGRLCLWARQGARLTTGLSVNSFLIAKLAGEFVIHIALGFSPEIQDLPFTTTSFLISDTESSKFVCLHDSD